MIGIEQVETHIKSDRMMKRYTLIGTFLVVLTGIGNVLYAQDNGHSEATASAMVLWNLDVAGIQDLQFDEITAGEVKVINLDGTVDGLNATGEERPGMFKITTPQSFRLEFRNLPTRLEGEQGAELPVEFFAAWSEQENPGIDDLNIFDMEEALSIPSANELREIYLFLGARVTPEQTQSLGDYAVQVTLSITHGVE